MSTSTAQANRKITRRHTTTGATAFRAHHNTTSATNSSTLATQPPKAAGVPNWFASTPSDQLLGFAPVRTIIHAQHRTAQMPPPVLPQRIKHTPLFEEIHRPLRQGESVFDASVIPARRATIMLGFVKNAGVKGPVVKNWGNAPGGSSVTEVNEKETKDGGEGEKRGKGKARKRKRGPKKKKGRGNAAALLEDVDEEEKESRALNPDADLFVPSGT